MSRREFSKVSPAIWRSKRFLALSSDRDRLLLFYYLTCQHQNSAGCFKLPDGYATADLTWSLKEYRASRTSVCKDGLVVHDPETDEIFVTGWFRICSPMNDKHASGTMSRISEIESDMVREVVEAEFTAVNKARLVDRIRARGAGNPDPE